MKVLVGISGGVDSAVCAMKLKALGYDVECAILRMHEYTEIGAAEEVARALELPLHVIDCTDAFEQIKDNFVNEYSCGRTPNPCVICNERVKFAGLYSYAMEHGFDRIATGHYCGIGMIADRYTFKIADDVRKDQSYMLYRLPQHVLKVLMLPLANVTKSEVRSMAEKGGIPVADKPDSQEICFLPDGGYAEYVESRVGVFPEGDFVSDDGTVLGKHKGIIRYTVGQRKGLGIALGARTYVTDIDPITSTVILSTEPRGSRVVYLSDVVTSGIELPGSPTEYDVYVKLRYTAPLVRARATVYPDGRAELFFNESVRSAPGQSAVAYDGDGVGAGVLFGGFISRSPE